MTPAPRASVAPARDPVGSGPAGTAVGFAADVGRRIGARAVPPFGTPAIPRAPATATLAARGIRAVWDATCGHLPVLEIDGAPVLWSAPWRDDPAVQADASIPPVDRRLGGTFACAPFGRDDAEGGPPHGAAANAPWRLLRASPSALTATVALARGRLAARIALRDGHPVLYQTHRLDLTAPCTFAHHPMIRAAGGAAMTTSATAARTFPAMEAPGVERLPPDAALDPAELETLPTAPGTDFVTLVHPPGLGWTAIARHAEGDTILFLRRAAQLPVTNLWLWNGGRDAAPWDGAAPGVIGVEDGICAGADGFRAALDGTSRLAGIPLVLPPGRHVVPHAIVRLTGASPVRRVAVEPGALHVATDAGGLRVPFDGGHLA